MTQQLTLVANTNSTTDTADSGRFQLDAATRKQGLLGIARARAALRAATAPEAEQLDLTEDRAA